MQTAVTGSPGGWSYAVGRKHNLPAQVSTFIGRADEIAALERLCGTTRLVTLTGTGGVGKTRLALQVGEQLIDGFAAGVWLVEFAGLATPDLVPQAVAAALNIPGQAGHSATESVIGAVGNHQLLLVIDNCEHVLDACAALVHQVLSSCPNLRVLATSRALLGVAGEHAWPVPSLSLPASLDSVTEAEAVQLFLDRMASVLPSFALAADNTAAVADVCTRLDGIPLALELAAARGNVLSPAEIARRLDDRFSLLVGADRTAPRRHHTLEAAVAWSYDLLTPPEQVFFERLSVFAGGWTLEAAESVCTDGAPDSRKTLDLLTQLVGKSLVVVEHVSKSGETRYRLLEMLREYATQRLTERGELKL